MLKLYSPEGNYKTNLILAVAKFANIPLEVVLVDYKYSANKEFIKKYPHASLPTLQAQNQNLFGTSAIIRYLGSISKNQLRGTTDYQMSLVDQWIDFSDNEIDKFVSVIYLMIFGLVNHNEEKYVNNKKNLFVSVKMLENHLKNRTFMVGNRITIADISIASYLFYAFKLMFDKKVQKDFINLTRWFSHISSLVPFTDVFGKMYLCQQEYRNLGESKQ